MKEELQKLIIKYKAAYQSNFIPEDDIDNVEEAEDASYARAMEDVLQDLEELIKKI